MLHMKVFPEIWSLVWNWDFWNPNILKEIQTYFHLLVNLIKLVFLLNLFWKGMYINWNFYCHSIYSDSQELKNFSKKKQLPKPLISKHSSPKFPTLPSLLKLKEKPHICTHTHLTFLETTGVQTIFASLYQNVCIVFWLLDLKMEGRLEGKSIVSWPPPLPTHSSAFLEKKKIFLFSSFLF